MSKQKKNKKRPKTTNKKIKFPKRKLWFLCLVIPTVGLLCYIVGVRIMESPQPEIPEEVRPALPAFPETSFQETAPGQTSHDLPMVALIIDDIGINMDYFDEILNINMPITLSVLPGRSCTEESVRRGREKGAEILLHLPMEPDGYPFRNPGRGAIFSFMTDRQIEEMVEKGLRSVASASGVNNHMGSRITRDPRLMRVVLQVLKRRHLFFIDSRTTAETMAFILAKEIGVRADSRSVFLDVEPREDFISGQIHLLVQKAKENGHAIGIGHKNRSTVNVLKEMLPRLTHMGVRPVLCSELPSLSAPLTGQP